MSTLYELSLAAQNLLDLLTDEEIDEQTFNDTLEAMGAAEKVENTCKVIGCLTADVEMFKKEIERCQKRKKTIENNIKWLKQALLNFYISSGEKQLKAGTFTVSSRKSKAVEIINSDLIPSEFVVFEPTINKSEIKKRLTAGEKVQGAELTERVSVQIR